MTHYGPQLFENGAQASKHETAEFRKQWRRPLFRLPKTFSCAQKKPLSHIQRLFQVHCYRCMIRSHLATPKSEASVWIANLRSNLEYQRICAEQNKDFNREKVFVFVYPGKRRFLFIEVNKWCSNRSETRDKFSVIPSAT